MLLSVAGGFAIALGLIGLLYRQIARRRARVAAAARIDQARRYAFEQWLEISNPNQFRRYCEAAKDPAFEAIGTHRPGGWTTIARQIGVSSLTVFEAERGALPGPFDSPST